MKKGISANYIVLPLALTLVLFQDLLGQSISFDGDQDYVNVNTVAGEITQGETDWAVSFWAKPDLSSFPENDSYILGVNTSTGGNALHVGLKKDTGYPIVFEINSIHITGSTGATDQQWNHIVYSKSGYTGTIYLNGVSQGTHGAYHSMYSSHQWTIGGEYDAQILSNEFVGLVDEVAVWDDDLTAAEVTALYNSGGGLSASSNAGDYTSSGDLQAYWLMNENSGSTIADATTNNNSGTITGATWSTDTPVSSSSTTTPAVTNVSSTIADGTYGPGDTLDVTVTFSEIVNVNTGAIGCGDFLINSLPFTHQYSNVDQGNEWIVTGYEGADVAYTLNLSDSTTISVTTCAVFTDYDTKLEIFTADTNCTATTTGNYIDDAACTISSVNPTNFAATLSDVTLAAGTYYIVVDGFGGNTGNYQVDVTDITGRFENDNYALNDSIIESIDHPEFLYIEDYNYEVNKLGRDGYRSWEIKEMLSITDSDPIVSSRTSGTNTPKITLETGATDSAAYYVSGTGTATILFQYVILSGDSSNDLDYISTSALEENGGTIRDVNFNDAILTLPTPGTAGSLAANKALVIDGIAPTVVSVSSTSLDSTYDVGSVIPITIAFNENVIATGTPQLELSTGVNTCLSFDGSDDYAFVPNHSDLQFGTGDFSISVWIKIDAIGSTQQIFCKRGGDGNYEIQVNSAGKLSAWAPGGFSGSTVLTANAWYNVTLTRDNGTSYLYLNGVLEASAGNSGNQNSTNGLSIGRDSYGGESYSGDIDEFAIWNSGLSAAEALVLYNGNASLNLMTNSGDYGSSSNLVLYLRMNDGSGNAAVDATGNGHNATLNNGVAWVNNTTSVNTTSVNYASGSGSTTLTFDYTVAAGQASSDLDYASTTAIDLNGGSITDLVGNVANLILPVPGSPGSLSANKAIVIENLPPAIPDGFSATASNRQIFLSWNQNRERDFYQYLVYGDTIPIPSIIVATITGISDTTVIIGNLENDDTYYYRLSAIDSSGLESEKTLDVYSVPRPQKYEVNPNETGDFISIQSAINYATEDDTLIVHNGTYSENIDLLGKALIIGSEYFTSGDPAHIASTVIDGQLNGSTITISDISGSEIKLVGFTIQNGSASDGGAIYSSNSNPVFENLIIKNSTASNSGGGIYLNNNSSAVLNKLTIINNSAQNGGGIYLDSSNPTITNIVFSNNNADSTGGAISMYSNSNPGIYNVVIYDNYSGLFGGAMQISNSNPTINYSTIIANHGEYHGGVLYLTNESEVVVTNSILYDNIPEQFFINDPEDSLTVSFSNVQGGYENVDYSHLASIVSSTLVTWAQSNIDANPLFNDASNDDFSLSDYSMAIGSGNSGNIINSDINGLERPAPDGSDPDIGAYENLRSIPDVWLTLENDQYFINEDSTLLFNPVLNDSIVNIHLVDLAIVDSANHGTLQIVNDSTISYQPDQNYFGTDTILYAFENDVRSDSALTIITIYMLEDDPPVITSSDSSLRYSKDRIDDKEMGYSRINGIIEFPVTLMDAYLFTYMKIQEDKIISEFQKTLDLGRSLSENNVISVLWHDNVLKMKGGRMYKQILEFLTSQDDVEIKRGVDLVKIFS